MDSVPGGAYGFVELNCELWDFLKSNDYFLELMISSLHSVILLKTVSLNK